MSDNRSESPRLKALKKAISVEDPSIRARQQTLLRYWIGNGALILVCLVLGLVAFFGAGNLGDPIASDTRTSSVYVEPGVDLDEAAAERLVGNRSLVLVYLSTPLGDRGSDICEDLSSAAGGSMVAIMGNDREIYGCSLIPENDDENFGKAYVSESVIRYGVEAVEGEPIQTVRVIVSNFDSLVSAGLAPENPRVFRPAAARYIVAIMAAGVVVIGSGLIYFQGRRLGHSFADTAEKYAHVEGDKARRDAALGALGVRLLEWHDRTRTFADLAPRYHTSTQAHQLAELAKISESYADLNEAAYRSSRRTNAKQQIVAIEDLNDRLDAL